MKKNIAILLLLLIAAFGSVSFRYNNSVAYKNMYFDQLSGFTIAQSELLSAAGEIEQYDTLAVAELKGRIREARKRLKVLDFWFRYMEPIAYKKINGPLPVEWETEVFEKFEAPYKREGAGLTLAALYLEEENIEKDSLLSLIRQAVIATDVFMADSITRALKDHHHFFLCNRLFLLNLAAIYTTGFECPDPEQVIPELRIMLSGVKDIYTAFSESYPLTPLADGYLSLYNEAINFAAREPDDFTAFDHFSFIRDYINPLFTLNQKMISQYKVVSRSMVDYSLNKKELSIFDKGLYRGQNDKGIFHRVTDDKDLAQIDRLGKLLFHDPILSGNNQRSCASCHKPAEFFTDTLVATSVQFDHKGLLSRNTPSLINASFNHLIMIDGKHYSLQHQVKDVITNHIEMGGDEREILAKVLSCYEYKKGFTSLLKYTPTEPEVTIEHLASAITFYYSKFSRYMSPFDDAMNGKTQIAPSVKAGFNLFMSKAECATCHFVPQFNGVKPPYIGSEFEVLGVPEDPQYRHLSDDSGRYAVNPAKETLRAFRTGTLRNAARTPPYMHNGVFRTLDEVIDFYNGGGGAGRGLDIHNQTLSADSLMLTNEEKHCLLAFMRALDEDVIHEKAPEKLPLSENKRLNERKVGGQY